MSLWRNQLHGPTDPAKDAGWEDPPPRKGFFTDTSICIGCKACEVACKEWNQLPMDHLGMTGDSYDNTSALGASTWRHVAFVEQDAERVEQARESGRLLAEEGPAGGPATGPRTPVALGLPSLRPGLHRITEQDVSRAPATGLPLTGPGTHVDIGPEATDLEAAEMAARQAAVDGTLPDFRWLIASDVCKHCTHAGCLDVCPTGALFRTEFGTVVVQADVCNGCGYCVPACPFGVIERRDRPTDANGERLKTAVKNEGVAQKCTLCYDRLEIGAKPACAQACPTTSIQFGDLSEMRQRAEERVEALHTKGFTEARVYGGDELDGVGGTGSVFLLLDEPEVYGLPPDPRVTTADLPDIFRKAGFAAGSMLVGAAIAFLGARS
ncbi:4Fe-4S dicluster domain-containing protein [Arsenicicoccus piscis]|uniref:Ferredoxin n=1 Tax=Arsenicicoccus piscis TaxID=673954 RepID=A0ABQ6HL07_9MICO|nr:4Fe-4S dicluster domain-containing protein [Arsenicicoccus piscis]MCH8626936.1 4Fe-4S dicluster domain-containing protein [Arsenicicoccus piscis]GMA19146.1 ferredoxin [Arsenicicoccus piscis]